MMEPGKFLLPHVMVDELERYGKRRGILNVFARNDNPQDGGQDSHTFCLALQRSPHDVFLRWFGLMGKCL
jgi:hypothetical protein